MGEVIFHQNKLSRFRYNNLIDDIIFKQSMIFMNKDIGVVSLTQNDEVYRKMYKNCEKKLNKVNEYEVRWEEFPKRYNDVLAGVFWNKRYYTI